MMVKLEANSKNLKLSLEVSASDAFTNSIFSDRKYALNKRLEAVSIGLRSELIMFLLDIEREMDIEK